MLRKLLYGMIALCAVETAQAQIAPPTPGSSTTVTATNGTTPRTLAQRAGDVINVKDNGAVGNAISLNACTIAASSTTLTCSGSSFQPTDVGKAFYLQGANTGFNW